MGDTFSRFAADQVIVAGSAADDGTEAMTASYLPDSAIFWAIRGISKSARDPGCRNICVIDAMAMEGVISAAEEFAADEFVETCDDDAEISHQNRLIYLL